MSRFRLRKQRADLSYKIELIKRRQQEDARKKALDDYVNSLSDEDRQLLFSSFHWYEGLSANGAKLVLDRQKEWKRRDRERIDKEWSRGQRLKKTLELVIYCILVSILILGVISFAD
jgi:hypothetical protein